MAKAKRLEVRYSGPFHLSVAAIGIGMAVVTGVWMLAHHEAAIGAGGASDGRILWVGLCAAALLYYAALSILKLRNRAPQFVVDRDGLWVGVGRDVLIPWSSIEWIRMRGIRPTLQIGVGPESLMKLRVSMWNLDDQLTSIPGAGAAFAIRGGGLDVPMRELADAISAWKPALPRR